MIERKLSELPGEAFFGRFWSISLTLTLSSTLFDKSSFELVLQTLFNRFIID